MTSLLDIGSRSAKAIDQEVPEPLFGPCQIVVRQPIREVAGPQLERRAARASGVGSEAKSAAQLRAFRSLLPGPAPYHCKPHKLKGKTPRAVQNRYKAVQNRSKFDIYPRIT
jgi:hypothetical protein